MDAVDRAVLAMRLDSKPATRLVLAFASRTALARHAERMDVADHAAPALALNKPATLRAPASAFLNALVRHAELMGVVAFAELAMRLVNKSAQTTAAFASLNALAKNAALMDAADRAVPASAELDSARGKYAMQMELASANHHAQRPVSAALMGAADCATHATRARTKYATWERASASPTALVNRAVIMGAVGRAAAVQVAQRA